MIRVLLTILTLAIVGAAGFGAYKYISYVKEKEFAETNDAGPVFVDLTPIYVPIVREGDLKEVRVFQLSLETREGGPYQTALRERGRIQDLMIRYLSALAERRGPENIDNLEYVREQLMLGCAENIGPGVVRGVAFVSIVKRPPT